MIDIENVRKIEVPKGHHLMVVMTAKDGDKKEIWNPQNPDEVATARASFDALKKKGYAAYRVVGEKGEQGELMHEFDPNAGKLIMAPAMRGG